MTDIETVPYKAEFEPNSDTASPQASAHDLVVDKEHINPVSPAPNQFSPPPDGGVVAWLQVLGAFFLWFCTLGVVVSFGVFQEYYAQNYLSDYSPSDIAWIGTIQGFLLFGAGSLSGPLFDRGYLRELLIAGTILVTLGLMTASVAREYYQIILSLGLCNGIGCSLLFTPSVAVIGTYFTTKRHIAGGISAAGGGVGMVLFTAIFKPLVNAVGFGWTMRIIAFIVLAGLLVSLAVLKQRPTPNKPRALIDSTAFREARFNVFAIACLLMFAGAYNPFFFAAVFSQEELHLSESMSFNMLTILGAGTTVGRLLPAFAAMRYGSLPVFAVCVLICGMLAFIWGAVHNLGGMVNFTLWYGIFGGGVASLTPVACVEMSPSLHVAGTRVGMLLLIGSLGVLIGNPIAGAILNSRSGFEGVQAFSGAVLLASSILLIVAWELLKKWQKRRSVNQA